MLQLDVSIVQSHPLGNVLGSRGRSQWLQGESTSPFLLNGILAVWNAPRNTVAQGIPGHRRTNVCESSRIGRRPETMQPQCSSCRRLNGIRYARTNRG